MGPDFIVPVSILKESVQKDSFDYVMEMSPKAKSFTYFQILRRLDSFEAGWVILKTKGEEGRKHCEAIWKQFVNIYRDENGHLASYVDVGSGFDCYLPYNERRDYIIKKIVANKYFFTSEGIVVTK